MATPKKQRIGIWIIAVVMLVGTLGSFAIMVLGNENAKIDQKAQEDFYAQYKKQLEEEEKQGAALSEKYYPEFNKYRNVPAEFNKDTVGDTVTTKDLKQGDGALIGEGATYKAYYIGWNPRGKVFDSSLEEKSLKAPINTGLISVIEGWNKGVIGMKVGGVREMTIPSDLAYGETGSGDDIAPNTPIKFIVMIIEAGQGE